MGFNCFWAGRAASGGRKAATKDGCQGKSRGSPVSAAVWSVCHLVSNDYKKLSVLFGLLILVKIAVRSGCDVRRSFRLAPACTVWRCLLGYMPPCCFWLVVYTGRASCLPTPLWLFTDWRWLLMEAQGQLQSLPGFAPSYFTCTVWVCGLFE